MSIEELGEFGLESMEEEEMNGFLTNQGMGVLGLPAENFPYLIPMSFGYDGDSKIYFTYILGSESRKEELTRPSQNATFLVYSTESMFMWESVLLRGEIAELHRGRWDEVDEVMENAWHPQLLEEADLSGGVKVYRLDIDEKVGVKHNGLPPGFGED